MTTTSNPLMQAAFDKLVELLVADGSEVDDEESGDGLVRLSLPACMDVCYFEAMDYAVVLEGDRVRVYADNGGVKLKERRFSLTALNLVERITAWVHSLRKGK